MRDSVALVIGGNSYSNFLGYEIDSNVLVPADAFSCRISRVDATIKTGDRFQLVINGELEMSGLIDKVTAQYSKGSQEMRIEGRDLMGLLIDASVEEWKTLKDMTLKDMGARLLKNIPYIKDSKIIYGKEKEDAGLSKPKKVKLDSDGLDTSTNVCHYEAGITVFEALSDYSQRHGLLMWMEPDGTLVFGELKAKGCAASKFSFYTYKGSERAKNNIISASLTDDISKRYSRLTVVAQVQGTDGMQAGDQTITKTADDKSFPFTKPLVLQSQCSDSKAAGLQAQLEVKKRIVEGWRLELVAAGHSQDGANYKANTVCSIKDEVLGLDDQYLILGRKFTLDRNAGPRTQLTIGKLLDGYTT
ncbi:MAG: hypothetical protein A3J24_06395 [Deltaproteobacteria bacterium RIFCSPLOWO2_02_FULL_53_8]|nr:MAG: hypothetical protein A3J24_06395 [Deltaproteobacteria bacterium RIFCSPLOWO2_02_FULL_53_8]